ncbi:nuclear transport factor 2 family protein [Gordonia sp. OPL2]|uniref:nuclear transport factor 2 family protein n=1 Tax=Gordonia sp. OPL2 TaxID=2486274 RepID=UPI0016562AE0|nr:nuclear transport factor 2 family protein [Gordonia sp. OPL2]ROZ99073.1 nuclear transport factor 2 family protein [Gordonia sp. OPL2]
MTIQSIQVDRTADVEDIRMLSARYARGLDTFDMDALMEPYAPDAVFDAGPMGLESYAGTDAIREFFAHNQEVMADQMHLFSNFIIEFDGDDAAHGSNYLLQDGHNKDGATVKCFCMNTDTYRRTADGWRIATRRISPLMPPQLDAY